MTRNSNSLAGKACPNRRDLLRGAAAVALATAAAGRFAVAEEPATGKIASGPDGDVFRVSVPLTTPRSGKDKRAGNVLAAASFSMFVPRDVKVVRGATFNPFHEPTVGQTHWRAAARHWGFAHAGANLFGVRANEYGPTLLAALRELARVAGRPEIEHLPLCVHGMSAGGGMAAQIVEALPGRVIAAAPVCLEVGPRDAASRRVPMLTIFGERDGKQMELLEGKLPTARAEHALWAIAPQWGQKHEWHRATDLVLPFYDRAIARRYPKGADPTAGPVALAACDEAQGWLGDRSTWRTPAPTVAPLAEFKGDRAQACWLPDAYAAAAWQAFASFKPPLAIASVGGVAPGQPFQTQPADKPIEVALTAKEGEVGDVRLFDGNKPLAVADGKGPKLTLPGLKAGMYALIASGTTPAGQRVISAPMTIVVAG